MNHHDTEIIRKRLFAIADGKYREFLIRILSCQGKYAPQREIIGVRLPLLRRLARELAKEDWQRYCGCAADAYYEEVLLWGLILGCAKATAEELLVQVKAYIPLVESWAVCDSLCGSLKWTVSNRNKVWNFLQPYFDSQRTYDIRFAIVMSLNYFLVPAYIDSVLTRLKGTRHPDYYVKKAVAWTLCESYIKFPEKTEVILDELLPDKETCKMALQKIIESQRVSEEVKNDMRQRRKKLKKED